jgi:hypothetical protein
MAWAGEVHFMIGRYWKSFGVPPEKTDLPGTAANRAITAARRRLPKGTRVEEVRVYLRRYTPAAAESPKEG